MYPVTRISKNDQEMGAFFIPESQRFPMKTLIKFDIECKLIRECTFQQTVQLNLTCFTTISRELR